MNATRSCEVAAKAMELEQAASAQGDVLCVIQRACELLEYCRATQSSYLAHAMTPAANRGVRDGVAATRSGHGPKQLSGLSSGI